MAVPDSQDFLSDEDLNDMARLNVLGASPPPEDPLKGGDEYPEDRGDKRRCPSPPLKIRVPTSPCEDKDDDEGLKTPTSAVHRISEMLQCPPAPRKPRSPPPKRRRASSPPVLPLDLSREVDSWFPRPIVVDVGGPIKKFKK